MTLGWRDVPFLSWLLIWSEKECQTQRRGDQKWRKLRTQSIENSFVGFLNKFLGAEYGVLHKRSDCNSDIVECHDQWSIQRPNKQTMNLSLLFECPREERRRKRFETFKNRGIYPDSLPVVYSKEDGTEAGVDRAVPVGQSMNMWRLWPDKRWLSLGTHFVDVSKTGRIAN